MKPLVIDHAPREASSPRLRLLLGAAGTLLAIVGVTTWLVSGPVEASHMVQTRTSGLPDSETIQATDQAVRALNLPWPEVLAELAEHFGPQHDALLLHAEADVPHATLRMTGAARTHAAVQALPERLRNAASLAAVSVLGEQSGDDAAWPVQFTLELRLREAP